MEGAILGVRSFIAVDIVKSSILDAIEMIQKDLLSTGANIKNVDVNNIHLTIRFLGDVREGLIEDLKSLVSRLEIIPFVIELGGVGSFPNLRRPRVIWVGISQGSAELVEVFKRLENELIGLGFEKERRGL